MPWPYNPARPAANLLHLDLLRPLLRLLLAGPLAVEAVGEVAERLLRAHQVAVVVDVLDLHRRPVALLLLEVLHHAGARVAVALPRLLVKVAENEICYPYTLQLFTNNMVLFFVHMKICVLFFLRMKIRVERIKVLYNWKHIIIHK